jgi:hypothetical protein
MPRQKNQLYQVPPTPRSPVPLPLPPPKLWHQSPPTHLFGTLKEGMAFGAGSEIAHMAMRSLFGSTTAKKSEYELCIKQAAYTSDECREMFTK